MRTASDQWKVFLDTSVLVSGILSHTGASSAILDLGEAEEIIIIVSRQVLVEADRTFLAKFPHLIERYRNFIKNLGPLLADDPSVQMVKEAARAIHPNDAPILAAAKHKRADYLVTLNTKHFMTPKAKAFYAAAIVTPAEFLGAFRAFWQQKIEGGA